MEKKKIKKQDDLLREIKLRRPVRIDPHKEDIMGRMNSTLAETPEWVLKMNSKVPKELPELIVKDLNDVLEKAEKWKME